MDKKAEHREYGLAHGHAPIAQGVVCIDFDGTLFPWGELFTLDAKPIPGAVKAMKAMKAAGFRLVIFTSRFSGTWLHDAGEDVREHAKYISDILDKNDIPWDTITSEKVPAVSYIDDKAIEFTGNNWRAITNRVLKMGDVAK